MFAFFATAKIKAGHRAEFIEATKGVFVSSTNDEPGCLHLALHADPNDENIVYLYEVYVDRAAPHFTKWLETVSPWFDGDRTLVELAPIFTKDKGKV